MNRPLGAFGGYGIELEYMIVDRETLSVRPVADRLLARAAGREAADVPRGRFAWSNELVLHLVEVKNTAPDASLAGLAAGFQAEVAAIGGLLGEFGCRLMPTGMHPWMNPATETHLWPGENAAIYETYDRIFGCRAHGWANLQSMHLNLPFADDDEFARLHAAARLILPILPALAASSPLAGGLPAAALDFRMAAYRHHSERVGSLMGRLVPDNAMGRAEYEARVLAPMYRDMARLDPEGVLRHEWLNTRGAIPRFSRNALEIRVIDVQECPAADVAIAALAAAAVRLLYRGPPLEAQQAVETEALREILLACTREGDRAVIDDGRYLALLDFPVGRCEAGDLWLHLHGRCAADPLLAQVGAEPLGTLLSRGPLARRILAALGPRFDRPRLAAVYGELCDCLAEGRVFVGP